MDLIKKFEPENVPAFRRMRDLWVEILRLRWVLAKGRFLSKEMFIKLTLKIIILEDEIRPLFQRFLWEKKDYHYKYKESFLERTKKYNDGVYFEEIVICYKCHDFVEVDPPCPCIIKKK